jgi:outer membrane protein OmpA-like peptidoglycan-associated protein
LQTRDDQGDCYVTDQEIGGCCSGIQFVCGVCCSCAIKREGLPPGSTIYPIHFPAGGYQLDPADQDTIRAVASKLKADPSLIAAMVGKTDATGSAEFNEHLSERRAQAVFEALVYANNAPQEKVEVY